MLKRVCNRNQVQQEMDLAQAGVSGTIGAVKGEKVAKEAATCCLGSDCPRARRAVQSGTSMNNITSCYRPGAG